MKELEDKIIVALKTVFDPEIPVDIYELGLIYDISVIKDDALVIMTLTSPNCPVAESLPMEVEYTVKSVDGINNAKVELTFDPPWNRDMMSEEALFELGWM
jgi:FeS assembly SUF system protein